MNNGTYNQIVTFIWNIADDCLRDVYVRGKYRDVILPMTVIRRLDVVLEDTKEDVINMKERLNEAKIVNQHDALCNVSKHSFFNSSKFSLKDLKSRSKKQQLKADFINYLDGFSENVQEILDKFKFRNQIDTMIDANILGAVIEKFVSPQINLSPYPVQDDMGAELKPGLDNHTMGVIFEELIRKFNEENNEEAGEHFTPRDVVSLMADLVFLPIKDKIKDGTYLCYDGASGTGGMLTIAENRLMQLAAENNKDVSIHLYGQELQPETYAIAKADLLLKGDGKEADNIFYGSTLSNDGHASMEFDFMLSNPPYGKSWKTDAEKLGGKKNIIDSRFVKEYKDDPDFSFLPRVKDGQLLFLANNIDKMKKNTEIGSRIAQVHNGSSLFTGDAGQGESNFRRYLFENDLVEAIIGLPANLFYNTEIGTYIWILSNKKEDRRKGKVQLIDATSLKKPLMKKLGKRSCELDSISQEKIIEVYLDFKNEDISKIYDNEHFGYNKLTIEFPEIDNNGDIVKTKQGKIKIDKSKTENYNAPLEYPGGIKGFFENEIKPYNSECYLNEEKTIIGYEVSFFKEFYNPTISRDIDSIVEDIKKLDEVKQSAFKQITKNISDNTRHRDTEIKNTNIPWMKSVPKDWKLVSHKQLLTEKKEIVGDNHKEYQLLSLSVDGVITRDMESGKGKFPTSFNDYQVVEPNDMIFCHFDIDETPRTVGLSNVGGMISGAYNVYSISNVNKRYLYYYHLTLDNQKAMKPLYTGLRKVINRDVFLHSKLALPTVAEQIKIVDYIDEQSEIVDNAIKNLTKEIELLSEYKKSLIHHVMTGKIKV